jgi:hypothetical protein
MEPGKKVKSDFKSPNIGLRLYVLESFSTLLEAMMKVIRYLIYDCNLDFG